MYALFPLDELPSAGGRGHSWQTAGSLVRAARQPRPAGG